MKPNNLKYIIFILFINLSSIYTGMSRMYHCITFIYNMLSGVYLFGIVVFCNIIPFETVF